MHGHLWGEWDKWLRNSIRKRAARISAESYEPPFSKDTGLVASRFVAGGNCNNVDSSKTGTTIITTVGAEKDCRVANLERLHGQLRFF